MKLVNSSFTLSLDRPKTRMRIKGQRLFVKAKKLYNPAINTKEKSRHNATDNAVLSDSIVYKLDYAMSSNTEMLLLPS